MRSLLGEIIARYETIAIRYLTSHVGDAEAARDIYQDVVRALLESTKQSSSLDHVRSYCFIALRNAATDRLRARARAREVPLLPDLLEESSTSSDPAELAAAEEDMAQQRLRLETLERAIQGLPAENRERLRLRSVGAPRAGPRDR